MKKIIVVLLSILPLGVQAQDGFYKDLFMDSGIMLTSRVDLPSARLSGFTMESFISTQHSQTEKYAFTAMDTMQQTRLISGYELDENGILLYPDGAPRFRCVYMNGGKAKGHGRSLGEKGRKNFLTFIKNGGSYLGSCAGVFLASVGTKLPDADPKPYPEYLGIWPGYATSTGLEKSATDIELEQNSPLLNYYSFEGKMRIDSVRHNGGCYGNTTFQCPEGTEVLARYGHPLGEPKRNIQGEPVVWAWKENPYTGRVVCCGSHPEEVTAGPRLELTAAMLKYAMEGNGLPSVKGILKNGETRRMDKQTHDQDPAFTRIGDRQYHHFKVEVPEGVQQLRIQLRSITGYEHFDLYLCARYGDFAFRDQADFKNVTLNIDKSIVIPQPQSGILYVSVFCATTVDTYQTRYGTQYTRRVDVLNGVPYELAVDMEF